MLVTKISVKMHPKVIQQSQMDDRNAGQHNHSGSSDSRKTQERLFSRQNDEFKFLIVNRQKRNKEEILQVTVGKKHPT